MSVIRTVAVHDVVRAVYPRPETARDEVAIAVGHAADEALARWSHLAGAGRRPTLSSMVREAREQLDAELADAHVALPDAERSRLADDLLALARGFRRSELFGLPRPRSRLILIDGRVGVYAQPDFWDRKRRIYEMKTYRAIPPPPDIDLQLTLFQLAFPGFEARLVCLDRHAVPLELTTMEVPPPTDARARSALAHALDVGLASGTEKVFEYIDAAVTRYELAGARSGP